MLKFLGWQGVYINPLPAYLLLMIVIVINNNGVVNVNQLQMVYECELEFMANNKFILTTYTGNGNCIINVLPGGANISCSVGICGTANLLYTDTYNFY